MEWCAAPPLALSGNAQVTSIHPWVSRVDAADLASRQCGSADWGVGGQINNDRMTSEAFLRANLRTVFLRAGLTGLAISTVVSCSADPSASTGSAEQAVINPPLPSNLNLILHAKTTLTVGAFSRVTGDVGSSGLNGSVLFDVSSGQNIFSFPPPNVLANTVTINTTASVGHVVGNDITNNGTVFDQVLGLDPATMPQVPAVTAAAPGSANVVINQNQSRQLCPGRYGALSLGVNSVLNLNGGVYQVTRLTLADGARLEPSEPVVILVSGAVTTGVGSVIQPSAQSLNPMTADSIRIETGGAVTIGDSSQIRAHVLATGRFQTARNVTLSGAAWARSINIGTGNSINGEATFSLQAPSVPPPCNDNNTCTADACVGGGTAAAFCRNTPLPADTSCADGDTCNGAETCDGAGACRSGQNADEGTSCPNGNACDGDERCNGFGSCLGGTPPEVDDGNQCTADACDPATGVSHNAVPDGTRCNGAGTCQQGVCSVQGAVFSEDFIQFQEAPAQCSSWNDFLDNRLSDTTYGSVSVTGTFDFSGVTCADPTSATQICQALHHRTSASVFCNGHTWNVGDCGGSPEIAVDNGVCLCTFGFDHTLRPCVFTNWGGVGTQTCSAQSQTMTIACQ